MANVIDKTVQASDPQQLDAAWTEFFLNADACRALLQRPKEQIVEIIKRGATVGSWIWTTTQAAVKVQALTGVALVAATLKNYNDAFLYSIALASEVDPGNLELADKQAEVAFKLAALWKSDGTSPVPVRDDGNMDGDDEEETEQNSPFAWEQAADTLPEDLNLVLERFKAKSLHLEVRELMEALPRWKGLKDKAEQNNHRQDASSKGDKQLKQIQQKVLGLMRVYAALHHGLEAGEPQQLGQQFFALLLELEDYILRKRKEASLPNTAKKQEPNCSPRRT
jgi:hypothetical protein